MDNTTSLEKPIGKDFQSPDLEIDFLIDSRAESDIKNIPTWNEIQTLHPNLIPSKALSKLATAQGSSLTNFEAQKMEQNKLLTKPLNTNTVGKQFITKKYSFYYDF